MAEQAKEKVSVTLNRVHVEEARRRAGPGGLSSYLDEALALKLQSERLRDLLAGLDAERGSVDPTITADAAAERWPP
jgi:hypothetical protein